MYKLGDKDSYRLLTFAVPVAETSAAAEGRHVQHHGVWLIWAFEKMRGRQMPP